MSAAGELSAPGTSTEGLNTSPLSASCDTSVPLLRSDDLWLINSAVHRDLSHCSAYCRTVHWAAAASSAQSLVLPPAHFSTSLRLALLRQPLGISVWLEFRSQEPSEA